MSASENSSKEESRTAERVCRQCGHTWWRHPYLEVACPDCFAKPGQWCRRPSGHSGPFVAFHDARDVEALRLGFLDHGTDCGLRTEDWPRAYARLGKTYLHFEELLPDVQLRLV